MLCNFCQLRQRECRPASADVSPRGPPIRIHEHGIQPRLCHITEQSATRDPPSGNQSTHFNFLEIGTIGNPVFFPSLRRV